MGNTQYEKNLRAVATACKNYVDETKEQILWQVGQYDITTQDDNTTAYQKVVPTGATRAKIKSIGFMSYKCNQLFDNDNIALVGRTFSGANQTIYAYPGFSMKVFNLIIGQTYTIKSTKVMYLGFTNDTTNSGTFQQAATYTFTASTTYLLITNKYANEYTEMFENLMLNYGSTALPYQPYFTGLRDSVITSVKSYDSNNNLIDTYTIPSEIQALEGYGRGINENCYNVLNLDTKEFTDKDGIVDLGTFDYTMTAGNRFYTQILTAKPITTNLVYNALCSIYNVTSRDNVTTGDMNLSIAKGLSDDLSWINIVNTLYNDATTFKTAMNGVDLQYELATYNTTNVSQYITNNVIEVEAGGYLVFENQYGQAVPSNVTYRIEVAR